LHASTPSSQSFAIHHLEHERKRSLYGEVFDLLKHGGVFANFEHVASPTTRLHMAFSRRSKNRSRNEDPSDRLLDVETQLRWLRELASMTLTATGSGLRWRC